VGRAVTEGLIARNPVNVERAGKENAAERPTLTIPQVYALADAIGLKFRTLVILAAFTGLRLGELRGLRQKNQVAKRAAKGDEYATREAITAALAAEAMTIPTMPRLLADDATPEPLTLLMADQGGRISVVSAEDVDLLVGAEEIARRLEVARPQTVYNWRRRYVEFPEPAFTLQRAAVCYWPEVEAWAAMTGRLPAPDPQPRRGRHSR
jgi:integrase